MNAIKSYLGDAVYAEIERGMIKLTTEDGISVTNTIYLDPTVIEGLLKYVEEVYWLYLKTQHEIADT